MRFPLAQMANPDRLALLTVLGFLVLRLVFAATTGFGVDESYTIGQSRFFSLSYLDHPPLHVWMAGIVEKIVGPHWAVRLPSILLFAGTGWVIYRLTRYLYGADAGLWALAALNVSPFFFASPGTWVVPDGPFLFFAALAGLVSARLFLPDGEPENAWRLWLQLGLFLGLAALSKYLAVFLALSVGLLIVTTPHLRFWLKRPQPYVAALVTLVLLLPVFVWNSQHDFASFRFQGGRGGVAGGLRFGVFAGMLLGQIVWLGPWLACFLYGLWRLPPSGREGGGRLLTFFALPPIVLLTLQSVWSGNALPHWTMGGWLFVIPALGAYLAQSSFSDRFLRRWLAGSTAAIVVLALFFSVEAKTAFLRRIIPSIPAKADPALDLFDWTALLPELAAMGAKKDGPVVVALKWLEGGKIDLVAGRSMDVTVAGDDPRHFGYRQGSFDGRDAIIVATRATFQAEFLAVAGQFSEIGTSKSIFIGRAGLPEIEIILAPAKGYRPLAR